MVAIEDYYGPVFKWTWNGRSDIRRMDSVGCFIKDLPVTFALEEGLSVEGFLKETVYQVKDGIAHGRGFCRPVL